MARSQAAGALRRYETGDRVAGVLAAIGAFPWSQVPTYLIAQLIGGFLGGIIVYLAYLPHWSVTESADLKLAVFSTGPAIRSTGANVLTEIIGTFTLVLGVLAIVGHFGPKVMTEAPLRAAFGAAFPPLLVDLLVWGIGLSLGGPTGYAINPARDLGPRIAHAILPIPGKRDSDWGYGWIPVVGPIMGGDSGRLVLSGVLPALSGGALASPSQSGTGERAATWSPWSLGSPSSGRRAYAGEPSIKLIEWEAQPWRSTQPRWIRGPQARAS